MLSMAHDPQMLKGVLSPLLLLLLDRQENYGYAVVTQLHAAGFEELNEGTVYPALTRLEKTGLLASTLRPSSSGPARKYYATTQAGRAEYRRLLESWAELSNAVNAIVQEES